MNNNKSISSFKIGALCLTALAVISLFLPWITMSASILGSTISESANAFNGLSGGNAKAVIMGVAALVAVLAALAAVFGILGDKKKLVLPLAVMSLVMFVLGLVAVGYAKDYTASQAGIFSSVMKVGLGIGAWLFLICGPGAYLILNLDKPAPAPAVRTEDPSDE